MDTLTGIWESTSTIGHLSFICGYCGKTTGVNIGYKASQDSHSIFICGGCNRPTFMEKRKFQTPAPILGNEVTHLPQEINSLYKEARHCTQVESYTACVLVCRKILMHVAVEKQASENESFLYYVEYLADKNYLPPDGKGWVDHIRKKGNEANHEIVVMLKDDAFELLSFVEMLLKFVYEMPTRIMPSNDNQSD